MCFGSSGSLVIDHAAVLPYPITLPRAAKGLLVVLAATVPVCRTTGVGSAVDRFCTFPTCQFLNPVGGQRVVLSGAPRSA